MGIRSGGQHSQIGFVLHHGPRPAARPRIGFVSHNGPGKSRAAPPQLCIQSAIRQPCRRQVPVAPYRSGNPQSTVQLSSRPRPTRLHRELALFRTRGPLGTPISRSASCRELALFFRSPGSLISPITSFLDGSYTQFACPRNWLCFARKASDWNSGTMEWWNDGYSARYPDDLKLGLFCMLRP